MCGGTCRALASEAKEAPPRKLGNGLEETSPVAGNPPWASTMMKLQSKVHTHVAAALVCVCKDSLD